VNLLSQVTQKLFTARTLAEVGHPAPDAARQGPADRQRAAPLGTDAAAGYTASAIRDPDATAIIDELGTLSFEEVHRRTNALAHSLSDAGVKEGDAVAIMIRNHRGFIDATVACSKLGAHALYLNTAFAGPQITEVVKREKPVALVYDAEFEGLTHEAGQRRKRFIAWHDGARSRRTRCWRTSSPPATPPTSSRPRTRGAW
jgi:fatty-acyl-CoA synthase